MSESIIFNSPIILVLYGVALLLLVYDLRNRTGAVLPYLSAAIVMGTSAYALVIGALLFETAAVICIFILINLYKIRGDKPAKPTETQAKKEISKETENKPVKEAETAPEEAQKVGEGDR